MACNHEWQPHGDEYVFAERPGKGNVKLAHAECKLCGARTFVSALEAGVGEDPVVESDEIEVPAADEGLTSDIPEEDQALM